MKFPFALVAVFILVGVAWVPAGSACTSYPLPEAPDYTFMGVTAESTVSFNVGPDVFSLNVRNRTWAWVGEQTPPPAYDCYALGPKSGVDDAEGTWHLAYSGGGPGVGPTSLDLWIPGQSQDIVRSWNATASLFPSANGTFIFDAPSELFWIGNGDPTLHDVEALPVGLRATMSFAAPAWGGMLASNGTHVWHGNDVGDYERWRLEPPLQGLPGVVKWGDQIILHHASGFVVVGEDGPGPVHPVQASDVVVFEHGLAALGSVMNLYTSKQVPAGATDLAGMTIAGARSGHNISALFLAEAGAASRIMVLDSKLKVLFSDSLPPAEALEDLRAEGLAVNEPAGSTTSSGSPTPTSGDEAAVDKDGPAAALFLLMAGLLLVARGRRAASR